MKEVAIIGVGQTSFVRGYEGSIRELAFDAFREAMQDAGITTKDVDTSIFCSAPEYDKQRSPAGVLAEYLGLIPQPTLYVESVCSASSSLHHPHQRHPGRQRDRDHRRGLSAEHQQRQVRLRGG